MAFFLQLSINALSLGSIYALTAIGYSMVYGVLELVNFAHGSVYMVGAFAYFILVSLVSLPWFIAFPLILIGSGLLGVFYEKLFLQPIRAANLPNFALLICALGVSIVLQNVMFLIMGSTTRKYPAFFDGKFFTVGGLTITYMQILIVIISAVALLGLIFFVQKTRWGLAMRVVAQNSEAAEWMGINVNQVISITFFLGSSLAALSGILSCMSFRGVDISVGVTVIMKAFAASVLGGIGNLPGAVLGGFIIAFAEIYTVGYISANVRDMSAFVLLILILLFRPTGILGKPVVKKV